jgi:hypothetical protein
MMARTVRSWAGSRRPEASLDAVVLEVGTAEEAAGSVEFAEVDGKPQLAVRVPLQLFLFPAGKGAAVLVLVVKLGVLLSGEELAVSGLPCEVPGVLEGCKVTVKVENTVVVVVLETLCQLMQALQAIRKRTSSVQTSSVANSSHIKLGNLLLQNH